MQSTLHSGGKKNEVEISKFGLLQKSRATSRAKKLLKLADFFHKEVEMGGTNG